MEALDLLGSGFAALFQPEPLIFMMIGVVLGILIGVLPGVGGTTGVAILLPVTVFLDPIPALVMLAGIYWGSLYGGSITSILFGVPGNPWSVATMFDGRPLAKKGKAQLALSMSFTVSFVDADHSITAASGTSRIVLALEGAAAVAGAQIDEGTVVDEGTAGVLAPTDASAAITSSGRAIVVTARAAQLPG